jgi:putative transposase
MSVKEICRSEGFIQPTFYKWQSRFSGIKPFDAAKLRELEAENKKLKKLLAEAQLDFHALNSVLSENASPTSKAPRDQEDDG